MSKINVSPVSKDDNVEVYDCVNLEIVNYLESLSFEVSSRRELLKFLMESGADTKNDSFVQYHKEYQDFQMQYDIAKTEFERTIISPIAQNGWKNWNLDFASKQVTITH